MRTALRGPAVLVLLAVLALAVASCGGGGSTTAGDEADSAPTAAAEKAMAMAEANCRTMLREVEGAAHGVLSEGFKNNLQLLNLGLGKPGLRIVKRMRERQQKLVTAIGSEAYETYVGLYNPIILYAGRSIKAAEIENLQVVTRLKEKLTTLGIEQGIVAHQAGLPACEINFLEAMVRATSP